MKLAEALAASAVEREPQYASLRARARRLFFFIALPIFLLVGGLAVVQYQSQRYGILAGLARDSIADVMAVDGVAGATAGHVSQMRMWQESQFKRGAVADPVLRRYFKPRSDRRGHTLDSLAQDLRREAGQVLWLDARADGPRAQQALAQAQGFFAHVHITHEISKNYQWSYFFPVERDHVVLYPWLPSDALVEQRNKPSLPEAIGHWFRDSAFALGVPDANPAHEAYWTEPHIDAGSGNAMISHGAPVYVDGRFRGVVGADLRLATLDAQLRAIPRNIGRFLLLDARGMVLADTGTAHQDRLVRAAERMPAGVPADFLERVLAAPGTPIEWGDTAVIGRPLGSAPWTLVQVVSEEEIHKRLMPLFIPYGLIAVALALTFLLTLILLRREFIAPALGLVRYLQRLSRDANEPEPRLPHLWRAWSALVRDTFFAYRQSEAMRASLVDQAPIAVIRVDERGHVVEFNPAAEAMFGRSRADTLGRVYHSVISPARHRLTHIKALRRFTSADMPAHGGRIELTALHADGHEFPVEVALARAAVGKEIIYTAFVTDLTDKRRAEDDLARQRDSMRQAEKMTAMGSLLAGVAHELNNPLAILIGRATLLEEKLADEKQKADAGKIRDAAQRCARIVRMFLSMARQRPAERRYIQLNDIVRSALDLLGYNLRTSGIDIRLHLARDLPEIEADPDQIGQVVTNLIVNAQQAMAPMEGEKRLVIGTTWNQVTRYVTLWVADNGPGVPAELQERIFDPFFTTKPEGSGTGIGLSVCKSIIKNHQGELHLEPTVDGATFSVSLPIQKLPEAVPHDFDAPSVQRGGLGLHVLIVDDEVEVAEMMAETLADAGYDPVIAYEGQGALVWLAEQAPDLILSDVRMPGLDGPGLWRALEGEHAALRERVIFVTGDTLSPGVADFLASTGCPTLEKPFTPAQLLAAVRARLPAEDALPPA